MKNLILISILLSFTLLLFSCPKKVCPPDEKKGDFNLKPTTLAYSPYSGNEKLFFKNSSGDSIVLEASEGKKISRDRLCVQEICTEPKIKGNTTCEYYASEANSLLFRDAGQTMLLDLLLTTENYQKNTQKFYSLMRLGFSMENSISSAGTITEIHFTGTFDQNESIINDFLIEKNEVILNGKTFSNIFAFEENPVKFYYSKAEGLVGFITPTDTFHLDRIE